MEEGGGGKERLLGSRAVNGGHPPSHPSNTSFEQTGGEERKQTTVWLVVAWLDAS